MRCRRRLRGQRGGGGHRAPRRPPVTERPRRTSRTPRTPRPSRPWSTLANARFPRGRPGVDRRDTLKNVVLMMTEPDGDGEPLVIGVPGDREVDLKRLEAQLAPACRSRSSEEDFAAHPELVKGYIGPQACWPTELAASAYLVDPRVVTGTAWLTGANEPGRHVVRRGRAGGTSPPTAPSRRPRCAPATPLPTARPADAARGASRSGTSSSSAASTPRRSASTCSDRERQAGPVTMGSYGIGVSRAVAAIAEQHHDEQGTVSGRGRWRRPTCTSWRPARTAAASTRRRTSAASRGRRAAGAARRPHATCRPG